MTEAIIGIFAFAGTLVFALGLAYLRDWCLGCPHYWHQDNAVERECEACGRREYLHHGYWHRTCR